MTSKVDWIGRRPRLNNALSGCAFARGRPFTPPHFIAAFTQHKPLTTNVSPPCMKRSTVLHVHLFHSRLRVERVEQVECVATHVCVCVHLTLARASCSAPVRYTSSMEMDVAVMSVAVSSRYSCVTIVVLPQPCGALRPTMSGGILVRRRRRRRRRRGVAGGCVWR